MSTASGGYVDWNINIAEKVALKFATGLPEPAKKPGFSDQMSYALTDGRRMYVPLFAADRIIELGLQPGEEFTIGKFEVRDGQKKTVRWQVKRIEEPETPLAASLRRSNEVARAAKANPAPPTGAINSSPPVPPVKAPGRATAPPVRPLPSAAPERPAPDRSPTPAVVMPSAPNDTRAQPPLPRNHMPAAQPSPAVAPTGPMNGQGQTLADIYAQCSRDAVDVGLATMAYAKERGMAIGSPSFEDLRCASTAMFIARTQR